MNSRGIGSYIDIVSGGTAFLATTDSDAVIASATIDRDGFLSGVLVVNYALSGASGHSLEVEAVLKEYNGSSWVETGISAAGLVTADAGGKANGMIEIDADFSGLENKIKLEVTPTRSNATTDTCYVTIVAILGGASILPC